MEQSFDVRGALEGILTQLQQFVVELAPRLLTGLVVLLLGLLFAKIIQRIVRGTLLRVKFDALLERFGVDTLLAGIGLKGSISRGLARLVYYLIVILTVQAASSIVGLVAVTNAISSFFGYLPNLIAVALILVLGNAVGQFAGQAVRESAEDSGLDYGPALGRAVTAVVGFVVAIMAVAQLGIDTAMIHTLVVISAGAAAVAFALSFGLGTREATRNIVAGFYVRKLFAPGSRIEVEGAAGTVEAVTSTSVLLEEDGKTVAVPNHRIMESTVRQD